MNFEEYVASKEALDKLNQAVKCTKDFTFPNDDITIKELNDDYPNKTGLFTEYSFIELIKKAYNLTEK